MACNYCLFQGPGATAFTNITSASARAPAPGASPGSSSGSSSLSAGAIGGLVAGALLTLALAALLVRLLLKRRKVAAGKDVELAKAEQPRIISVENRVPRGTAELCRCAHAPV